MHLAATVTDRHGTALVGATITWSSTDSQVATVSEGLVVAHSAGSTTIVAAVGDLLARASVVVRPRVAALHLASDSAVVIPRRNARQSPRYARGHVLGFGSQGVAWRSGDSVLASVDTSGRVTGITAGRTTVTASVAGVSALMPITILPVPGVLSLMSGSAQDGAAGTPPTLVTVRLTSRRWGRPLSGVTVHFRRVDAGGAADAGSAPTDGDGRARIAWRLGEYPGRQRLTASVDGLDSSAVAEAEAEPVAAHTRVALLRDRQSAPIVTALPAHVGIRLTDSEGRALIDVPVRWEVVDSGSVTALSARSDSSGDVEATWVLGPRAGSQRLRALIGNGRLVRPALLHATALAGPAVSLRVVSGAGQHARAGASLPNAVVLRVADAAGNPVPGVRVAIKLSAGSVADSAPITDSAGLVRNRWSLPTAHGGDALHLSARVDGIVQPVEVTAFAAAKPSTQTSTSTTRH